MRQNVKNSEKSEKSLLSMIRANRRGLRQRGLTGSDLLAVEAIAFVVGQGRKRSVRVADLARLLGVSRQAAHARVKRLEIIGALFRVGGAVLLNVRGLLRWSVESIAARVKAASRSFKRTKQDFVKHLPLTIGQKTECHENGASDRQFLTIADTVAENKAWLAEAIRLRAMRRSCE